MTHPIDVCYCGRELDVRPGIVCSGCGEIPSDCTCEEVEDAEVKTDPERS